MSKKRTNRPRKVKIGECHYQMIGKPESWHIKKKAYGMIHYHKPIIEVWKDQNDQEMVNTVIHEILHGIVEEYNVEFANKRDEEKVVTRMADGIEEVFRDNPRLIEWIKNKSQKK